MTDCHFCGTKNARVNTPHWTGTEYVRIQVCTDSACREQVIESAPRCPRRPRATVVPATDYHQLVAFMGEPGRKGR